LFLIDFFVFLFVGAIFGSFIFSFINRQTLTLEAKAISITSPPSFCPSCKRTLKPLMLIPIISYLFLMGKCWYCKSKIKVSYLIYELLIGLFTIFFFINLDITWINILLYLICILIIIQILLDYKFLLLSTNISTLIIILGLALALIGNEITITDSFLGICLGYSSLWLLNFIFKSIKSKDGIGDGDFIFLASLCSVLGYKLIGPIVLGGSIISLLIYITGFKEGTLLPFGTGMGLATLFLILFL